MCVLYLLYIRTYHHIEHGYVSQELKQDRKVFRNSIKQNMNEEHLPLVDKKDEDRGYIELLQLHKSFTESEHHSNSMRSKLISNPFMVPIIFLMLISIMLIIIQIFGLADLTVVFE